MQRYQCNTCRYVYDPSRGDSENDILAGTQFDDLPYEWMCPECGSGLDFFELMQEAEEMATTDSAEGPVE